MINITLPDGSVRQYQKGTTSLEVAASISEGLARNVLSAKVNDEVWDATRPLTADCHLKLLTWNDDDGKQTMWHSSAHLMAEALEALYPGAKFAIGPAIENGFYYDVDFSASMLQVSESALFSQNSQQVESLKYMKWSFYMVAILEIFRCLR